MIENKLWWALKQLGYSKRLKTKTTNISLCVNDVITSDKSNVADSFNTFFSSFSG